VHISHADESKVRMLASVVAQCKAIQLSGHQLSEQKSKMGVGGIIVTVSRAFPGSTPIGDDGKHQ
jgi:hypothetical protein